MSIKRIGRGVHGHFVIVRGAGGVARKLRPLRRRGQLFEVVSLDKTASICVPAIDVFAFDRALLHKLNDAEQTGDMEEIAALWTLGRRYYGEGNGQ